MVWRFGLELEFTGLHRQDVAKLMMNYFGASHYESVLSTVHDDPYFYYVVRDAQKRRWKAVRDRSITSAVYADKAPSDRLDVVSLTDQGVILFDDNDYKVELVTPALTLDDLPVLLGLVTEIRQSGGIVNHTTGIHIHVDANDDLGYMMGLLSRFAANQDAILSYFKTEVYRREKYCKPFPPEAVQDFTTLHGNIYTVPDLLAVYRAVLRHGVTEDNPHPERYYALNYHSVEKHNTVEFRFFNSTLESSEVQHIVEWVYAFTALGELHLPDQDLLVAM